ncbi:MAG: LysM peptidoglycan-binding domain-containing protein, partial [Gemmatimonadota bacterium]|nr:LysM peptidoglycan-binding domain-containing protein [Gemmatimonadota bacterium]
DLVYLSMIESGFSSRAVSRASAVGPWQFMSYTGREYGLRIDRWVDERMDWEAATSAAIAYLSDLHAMFGSWYLAAAGYNGGQGRVGRSMVADNTINFWELTNLHRETKDYVPKLIAATLMAKEPGKYGFGHVAYLDPVRWEQVTVPTSTDLDVVASAAEVSPEMIRMLNPHLIRGRTPPGERNFPVKVPRGRAETFNENYFEVVPQERLPVATHPVREGETLAGIAAAYGVEVVDLLRENGLRRESDLEPGMSLKVPGVGAEATATAGDGGDAVDRGLAAERRLDAGRTHRVRPGETLTRIARRYGVSVTALKRANDLRGDVIRVGQRLTIP